MRVLLVNPGTECNPRFKTYAVFPNGLLFLAAVLEKHGHQVQIYDNVLDSRKPEDFIAYKPDIVGYSVLTGTDITQAIAQTKEFKKVIPGVKTVWGNVHPSVLPEQTIREPYIDYVIVGAGEYALLKLVDHLEKGANGLKNIEGLVYKENGQIYRNEATSFAKDLDELPNPAWHLIDVKKYWAASLNTSRGCPFRCTFCYNSVFNKGYRGDFSAERIVSQVKYLQRQYGVKFIRFFEDNFTFNRKRLQQFCRLIIAEKINFKWDCEARADLSEEDIALMARAGCTSIGLGVETGSQKILNFLKKGVDLNQMEKSFWLIVKHKIAPRLYIMEGLPTETVEDFNLTHQLLKKLDHPPYLYMRFVPYAGTPLFDYCVSKELIDPPQRLEEWADFAFMSATRANLSQVPDEIVNNAFAEYIRTYVWRRLRFTLRHNPSYFWMLLRNPVEFYQAVKGLVKNSLPVFFNKNSSLDASCLRTQKLFPRQTDAKGSGSGQSGSASG
ncbi:Anaerobic magnesium-protoporphyrin IX monomethyl ester cyclase [subsurface metagenome]